MNCDFWKNKKVFITGNTGFKGSWLCLLLEYFGSSVIGYSLEPPTTPSLFNLANVEDGIKYVNGDVRQLTQLEEALNYYKPEIVIHMAAQSLVLDSYKYPIKTYETNVLGVANLLEAIKSVDSIKVVLVVTSDKCYKNREMSSGYNENDSLGGYDPYSSSKACAELVTSSYRNSYFNPDKFFEHGVAVASARSGNVIGGGDFSPYRIIPDIINSITRGETVLLRNPDATRPWQYVLDCLNGYLILCEKLYESGPRYSEAWNFGPKKSEIKPVSWIVEEIISLWGTQNLSWKLDKDAEFHETYSLYLDSAKARNKLGWTSLVDISTSLMWIIEWAKGYINKNDIKKLTFTQIDNYLNYIKI